MEDEQGSTEFNMRTPQMSKPPGVQEELAPTKTNNNGSEKNGGVANGSPFGGAVGAEKGSHKAKVFVVIAFCFLLLGAAGFAWWTYAQGHEETDDAYVDAHISVVSSRVSGNVTRVLVDDNQRVQANQLLVELDPKDYQVEVDQLRASLVGNEHQAAAAKAKIGQSSLSAQGQSAQASGDVNATEADIESARAALSQMEAAVKRARAHVAELQAGLQYAKTDFERYETAWQNKAVTKQAYDRAKQNIDVAEAQLRQGQEELAQTSKQESQAKANIAQAIGRLQKSHGTVTSAAAAAQQELVDKEQYESAKSAVDRQKAQLEKAMLNLSYCQIVAPISGRIGKKSVEVGQRIEPGQALMAVVQDNLWVTANFKETQLAKMKAGQRVEVRIDSFPDKVFAGRVDSFSPASGAKFSVLPPDNASGNFTKVVQRIPVKILLDKEKLGDYAQRISPGMSCVVTVIFK
jgi:membrane fusion protein (multidrug efflux system)